MSTKQEGKKATVATSSEDVVMSLDDIFNVDGSTFVTAPAWGGKVRLKSITAGEAIEYLDEREGGSAREAGMRMIARSLVDAAGQRLCKTKEDEDKTVAALKGKDVGTCTRLVNAILKLNGLDAAGQEEQKKAEAQQAQA